MILNNRLKKRLRRFQWRAYALLTPLLSLSRGSAIKPIIHTLSRISTTPQWLPSWALPATAAVTTYHTISGATQITYDPEISGGNLEVELGDFIDIIASIASTEQGSADSYTVAGSLPPGVEVLDSFTDAENRTVVNSPEVSLVGTTTHGGTFIIELRGWKNANAPDPDEASPIYRLTIKVVDNRGPIITQQPLSTATEWGGEVTFSVVATNAIGLQWRRNGSPISDGPGVSGANSSILHLSKLTSDDDGTVYDLQLRGMNQTSLTSESATLSVSNSDYDRWRENAFNANDVFDDNVSGPQADPEQDQRTNLFEFIFNSSPGTTDPVTPYITSIDRSNPQSPTLQVQFPRNPDLDETEIVIEKSLHGDNSWTPLSTDELTTENNQWTASISLDSDKATYLRLRVPNE